MVVAFNINNHFFFFVILCKKISSTVPSLVSFFVAHSNNIKKLTIQRLKEKYSKQLARDNTYNKNEIKDKTKELEKKYCNEII